MLTADRFAHLPPVPRPRHRLLAAAGAAGLGFAVCALLQVAAILGDAGGACAAGGPYVIETPCSRDVLVFGTVAVPLGMVSGGLLAWGAATLHRGAGVLALLAWPGLFGGLGVQELAAGRPFAAASFLLLAAFGWPWRRAVRRVATQAPGLVASLLAAACTGAAGAAALVGG